MITKLKDRITTSQAVVIIVNYILGTGILTLPRASVEKVKTPDVWISVILGGILAMVSGVSMVKLSQQCPEKTGYQYRHDSGGKWRGRLLSFLIIGYFLTTSAFQLRSMAEV
ncbi:GerAB/ArcD/ProY family transporter, partial [Bacillus thuringiensis]|uniref:GerAB/ArcD/ProY family transporter n=1 Tax=Bacillus thuringiensis TaxID=1428 RepID=UPI002DB7023B